jgi:hypothetical protein
MTDIPHDHLGQPDLQALVRQCGGFDKISLELWTAWDRANARVVLGICTDGGHLPQRFRRNRLTHRCACLSETSVAAG